MIKLDSDKSLAENNIRSLIRHDNGKRFYDFAVFGVYIIDSFYEYLLRKFPISVLEHEQQRNFLITKIRFFSDIIIVDSSVRVRYAFRRYSHFLLARAPS